MMKAVVEKYVSIWNSNGIPSLTEVFDANSTYWDSMQNGGAIELLTSSIAATHESFSEVLFQITSLNATSEGECFLEWHMTGVNTGEFFGHPATGKNIEIKGLDLIRFESDKIAEIKSFYDSNLFNQQLGLQ